MAAVGLDLRTEKYRFNGNDHRPGDAGGASSTPPFDSINTLDTVKRDMKAVFTEVQLPVTKNLEVTLAARYDDYTGFGSTTNPKVSLRFAPLASSWCCAARTTRASACPPSTSCSSASPSRPTAARTWSTRPAAPAARSTRRCRLRVDHAQRLHRRQARRSAPRRASSGRWRGVGTRRPSSTCDWWSIRRDGTIQALSLAQLVANYTLFPEASCATRRATWWPSTPAGSTPARPSPRAWTSTAAAGASSVPGALGGGAGRQLPAREEVAPDRQRRRSGQARSACSPAPATSACAGSMR
jgi:iron complex outermembrane receptor protein